MQLYLFLMSLITLALRSPCHLATLTAAVESQDSASRKGAKNVNFIIVAAHQVQQHHQEIPA